MYVFVADIIGVMQELVSIPSISGAKKSGCRYQPQRFEVWFIPFFP